MNNQRWKERREAWRPAGELFDAKRYTVDVVTEKTAKAFIETHHYSGSYPAARCRVGLFEGASLVGVAVFSVPMNSKTVKKYFGWKNGGVLAQNEGVELGRFVLLDNVAGNGETWFLSRAFKLLRAEKPEVRGVVSYSDPVPRQTSAGRVLTPGHVGTIYQALNGSFHGRGSKRHLIRTHDWQVVSERMLSKLRNDERGAGYAYDTLRKFGAPERAPFEDGVAYVARALLEGPFTRLRHPGNFVYTWGLDPKVKPLCALLPFPKKRDLDEQGRTRHAA